MFIGVDLDLACLVPTEPRREHEPILTALGLGVAGRQTALSHQAQLVFRHCPLQPQKQTIIHESWIVGAVRIYDQSAGKGAQVDQMMPVSPIARQA
jgi:hypothetical protein